jgi:signal transduction histidine kinase
MQTIGIDKGEEAIVTGHLGTAAQSLDNVIMDLNHILDIKNTVGEKRETINFEELLQEVKSSINNVICDEHVYIVSDFSAAQDISTIKSYLYSIFYNLVTNSIKYRQQDIAPVIEISSTRLENKILLLFKDNGLGIDLEKRKGEIFGLYKRFHDHVEGKGIGLYMVKAQVEALGGTVSLTSTLNKGTEFSIEFEVA